MIRNIEHYSKLYKGVLDKKTCDDTIEQTKNIEFEQHTFYDPRKGTYGSRSGNKELDVSWGKVPNTKVIMDKIWHVLKQYQSELDFPWFNTWEGYSVIRYNKYLENRKMALHADHIKSLFDGKRKGIPVLSVLGLLNDDFKGGEFVLFDNEIIPLEQGDLLIFPSNFMYPHKVEPVTKGTRHSYISWVW
jgi:hypothetical protein|tara:strand:+ start:78 stop:644 length:567 start_codon:yes stop_codon:yes gene_type:complete